MSVFIRSMHAIAVRRGDGLLPELVALLERRGSHSVVAADAQAVTTTCASADSRAQKSRCVRAIKGREQNRFLT